MNQVTASSEQLADVGEAVPSSPASNSTPAWAGAALDALAAHVAILDQAGVILAVNRAWREFGRRNGLRSPGAALGVSYLSVCRAASGEEAADGRVVAEGIAQVSRGEREDFTHQYPCVCDGTARWYLLHVRRMYGAAPATLLVTHEDVTERQEAQVKLLRAQEALESRVAERTAAMAHSDELHRHIIESLPGGVIHIASTGAFLSANGEALRFLGLSIDRLTRRVIVDYAGETMHEDGRPCPVEDYPASKCLKTGKAQPPQTIGVRRGDGSIAWAVFTAVPVACPVFHGRIGTVVTFLNITERKRAEEVLREARAELERRVLERTAELGRINEVLRQQIEERTRADAALRESEARFRQIAENITEVVWIVDTQAGGILYINPAYESVWGQSCERLYANPRSFLDSVLPEDVPIALEGLAHQPIEPYDNVYRIRGSDGQVKWIRSRSTPIRDAAGHVYRVTGIAEDITDLKRAEAELARLASIVESSDDSIVGMSLEGKVLSWNSGAQELYGYSVAEVVGQDVDMLMHPEQREKLGALLERVGKGERVESFEAVRVRKDCTSLHVSLTLSSVKDSDGNVIGASAIERDITERRRLEQQVLRIGERERRRIGQDLHDGLGQDLTGIAFLGKSLQHRLETKAASGAGVSPDEAVEARQIADLVQQAIGQTRALARGLHPVEQSAGGLSAALLELAHRVEAVYRIRCRYDSPQSVAITDDETATHLYRIAQEAVNNAVKYSRAKSMRISFACSGDHISLTVADDGIGIPEQAQGNTGLGLGIMRYRAKMINGSLGIHRAAEGGTVVTCDVDCGCSTTPACSEEDLV